MVLPDPTHKIDEPFCPLVPTAILNWGNQSPQAPAINHDGRTWTYSDIYQSSYTIAQLLLAHGLKQEETVGIVGDRGFLFVSSMIGVLIAGGVLLTLDSDLPDERLRTMLHEANTKFLLYIGDTGGFADKEEGGCTKLSVNEQFALASVGQKKTSAIPLPLVSSEHPAYIFFTSGTTGVPKGVKGLHKGLAHFVNWQRTEFDITSQDRAAQLTALSFDVVLRDIFTVLSAGGTLCIPGKQTVLDPSQIITWLKQQEVTMVHLVPSLARMWLNYAPDGMVLDKLRKIFFAGEPLMDTLILQWRSIFGSSAEIVNLYGPTETTLAKCFKRIGEIPDSGVQPIGKPIPNTQIIILNSKRRQCGLNEAGEIAIRTPFRTLGYINNSDAKGKAFIFNPFADDVNDKNDIIYLTGDRGLCRNDGIIEIHGRLDQQIKIRGIRIEPGEIESVIKQHASVLEVTVTTPVDKTGEKFLAAYIIAENDLSTEGESSFIQKLRNYLRECLPENMVPSAFVLLKELPLTSNGKIDKKNLPFPGRKAFVGADYSPPKNILQRDLVNIWQALLTIEPIGIDDDFFDLGGHSLMAMELVQQMEKVLNKPCFLPMVFQNRTIRLLAAEFESDREKTKEAFVVNLQNTVKDRILFCVVGINLYQHLADELASDCQVNGIFVPYEETFLAFKPEDATVAITIEKMSADYVKAIRNCQEKGPYFLVGVSFGGILAFEIAQQLTRQGEHVAFLGILDSMLPVALSRNWFMWLKGHLVNLRNEGLEYLFTKLKNRARQIRKVSYQHPVFSSVDNVGSLRGKIYKQAEQDYKIKPYTGHAVLVKARENSWFSSDISDPTYGWGKIISDLEIIDVSGDHLGILTPPYVNELAEKLRPFILAANDQLMFD